MQSASHPEAIIIIDYIDKILKKFRVFNRNKEYRKSVMHSVELDLNAA